MSPDIDPRITDLRGEIDKYEEEDKKHHYYLISRAIDTI
jgi:hypothetical protein